MPPFIAAVIAMALSYRASWLQTTEIVVNYFFRPFDGAPGPPCLYVGDVLVSFRLLMFAFYLLLPSLFHGLESRPFSQFFHINQFIIADRRATARTTTFVEPCSIQIKTRTIYNPSLAEFRRQFTTKWAEDRCNN